VAEPAKARRLSIRAAQSRSRNTHAAGHAAGGCAVIGDRQKKPGTHRGRRGPNGPLAGCGRRHTAARRTNGRKKMPRPGGSGWCRLNSAVRSFATGHSL
jgi:hypothetical protein